MTSRTASIPKPLVRANQTVIVVSVLISWVLSAWLEGFFWILLIPLLSGLSALALGVKVTGTTVHVATAEVDDGPILAQGAVPVLPGDTEETLHERIKVVERAMLVDAPALLLSAEGGVHGEDANSLHEAWRGELVHRRMEKAIESGLVERNSLVGQIGLADPDRRTQRTVRPLLAGYLLATLLDDDDYAAFASNEAKFKDTVLITDELLAEEEDQLIPSTPPLLKLLKGFTGG